jgi:hypothetical protein
VVNVALWAWDGLFYATNSLLKGGCKMREIKFRAWNIEKKIMVYSIEYIRLGKREVGPWTTMLGGAHD